MSGTQRAKKATPNYTSLSSNVLALAQSDDFKRDVLVKLGDISDKKLRLFNDEVLLATYITPEKTSGGIIMPQRRIDESRYQGKVGLVLKLGPTAFKYDGAFPYEGYVPQVGEYVMCFASDPREVGIRGVSCKIVKSQLCRMWVDDPADIW